MLCVFMHGNGGGCLRFNSLPIIKDIPRWKAEILSLVQLRLNCLWEGYSASFPTWVRTGKSDMKSGKQHTTTNMNKRLFCCAIRSFGDDYLLSSAWVAGRAWTRNRSRDDPCPYGWKVTYYTTWDSALGNGLINTNSYDAKNGGRNFRNTFSDIMDWYPSGGYLDYQTGNLVDFGVTACWCGNFTFREYYGEISPYRPFSKGLEENCWFEKPPHCRTACAAGL